jgi:hypothetical protein
MGGRFRVAGDQRPLRIAGRAARPRSRNRSKKAYRYGARPLIRRRHYGFPGCYACVSQDATRSGHAISALDKVGGSPLVFLHHLSRSQANVTRVCRVPHAHLPSPRSPLLRAATFRRTHAADQIPAHPRLRIRRLRQYARHKGRWRSRAHGRLRVHCVARRAEDHPALPAAPPALRARTGTSRGSVRRSVPRDDRRLVVGKIC